MSIYGRIVKSIAVSALTAGVLFSGPANALTYVYDMLDHPDGNQSANYDYGLRLDRMNPDMYFSAEDTNGNSILELRYSDTTNEFLLTGQVRLNGIGGALEDSLWNVKYGMSGTVDGGNGTFGALAASSMFADSLVCASIGCQGSADITIGRKSRNSDGLYFALGFPGLDPHGVVRGGVLTATGWAAGSGTNDWLLSGVLKETNNTPIVPLPGAALLLLSGLAGLGFAGYRKSKG